MRRGFTLTELLIVITILAVLMGLLFPAIGMVRTQANTVRCSNNLHQIALAIEVYRQNHNDVFPGHLAELIGEGFNAKSFLCPFDKHHGSDIHMGRQPPGGPGNWGDYSRLHEANCSYTFEASGLADSSICTSGDIGYFWRDQPDAQRPTPGSVSWADGKMHQQKFGNLKDPSINRNSSEGYKRYGMPFSPDYVPIVRCYWHADWAHANSAQAQGLKKINNITLGFNTVWSTPYWELDQTPNLDE